MNETYSFTILGHPITKKNSMRMVRNKAGRTFPMPSKAYVDYKKAAVSQISPPQEPIDYPVNIKAVFYMGAKRRVDLTNLLEGLDDLLVDCGVLLDDNCLVLISHDGSRVHYDKENPRVEVLIEPSEETSF